MPKIVRNMLYILVIFVCLIGLSAFYVTGPILGELPQKPDFEISVDTTKLKADVYYLADSCYPRSFENQEMLNKAASYVNDRFEEMGYITQKQNYKAKQILHHNIVTQIGPETDDIIVIGAHYDVCGEQPGADDNGSAVAGLLALAELAKKHEKLLTTRIEFVAYTLEEPPFFRTNLMGSYVHAEALAKNKKSVRLMVCLEMIGYFSDEPKSQDFPVNALKMLYPTTGDFITVVGKIGESKLIKHIKKHMKSAGDLPVESITAPSGMPGIDLSDHRNYWKFNFPAVMITDTSFYRNKNYHQKSDTPETLNYPKMAEVVKGVFWGVLNL